MAEALPSRNVYVAGRRTSMRLEGEYWDALAEIAEREGLTVDQIVTLLAERLSADTGLSRAVRVWCLSYYRHHMEVAAGISLPDPTLLGLRQGLPPSSPASRALRARQPA